MLKEMKYLQIIIICILYLNNIGKTNCDECDADDDFVIEMKPEVTKLVTTKVVSKSFQQNTTTTQSIQTTKPNKILNPVKQSV
jgi:hypothetical protein